jgi:multidrug transporter EmrE-like cation transporter
VQPLPRDDHLTLGTMAPAVVVIGPDCIAGRKPLRSCRSNPTLLSHGRESESAPPPLNESLRSLIESRAAGSDLSHRTSMQKLMNLLSLGIFATTLAIGQVMFKRVGLAIRGRPLLDSALYLLGSRTLYIVLSIYAVSTFLWIWILSRIPLSQAYPWVAIGMAIVPLLGWYVFGERVEPLFWFGISLILAGVIITQYASQPS